jgi:ABC-type glycerol-3-phosphate transport system permease component
MIIAIALMVITQIPTLGLSLAIISLITWLICKTRKNQSSIPEPPKETKPPRKPWEPKTIWGETVWEKDEPPQKASIWAKFIASTQTTATVIGFIICLLCLLGFTLSLFPHPTSITITAQETVKPYRETIVNPEAWKNSHPL